MNTRNYLQLAEEASFAFLRTEDLVWVFFWVVYILEFLWARVFGVGWKEYMVVVLCATYITIEA